MLIALLIGCLLYFGSGQATALAPQFDEAEAGIKKYVPDETRRKEAMRIVGDMKSEMKDFTKRRENSGKSLKEALHNREATADDLRAAAAPLMEDNRQARERMLDLQFQLRKVLTAEEWAQAYPKPAAQR
ncbi:MAG TPA: hypothetical protein VH370_25865 [Humisphaera sp.]|jgi:hypothetical protein|nr:hypothetical protein [Humisphaera sp.]